MTGAFALIKINNKETRPLQGAADAIDYRAFRKRPFSQKRKLW
jgi:hypothetical protein